MRSFRGVLYSRRSWLALSIVIIMLLLVGVSLSTNNVSANHPVLLEGNCDSPTPGTTILPTPAPGVNPSVGSSGGVCGDYDGDGRIGTAEDTDGADRIFGTLKAALGPGTGAAAGTGANNNGTITIVRSGRFAEQLLIGNTTPSIPGQGTANPGNVTIEAAPGVEANINAVLQGDPANGNAARLASTGITINYANNNTRVVLRNLTISNFATGVQILQNSRVTIDHCRFENNLHYGIRVQDDARLGVFDSRVSSTGFRINSGVAGNPGPGHGISYENTSAGEVAHSHVTASFGAALSNTGTGLVTYYELFLDQNLAGPIIGATRNNTP
jgi:Right handed beta helix region